MSSSPSLHGTARSFIEECATNPAAIEQPREPANSQPEEEPKDELEMERQQDTVKALATPPPATPPMPEAESQVPPTGNGQSETPGESERKFSVKCVVKSEIKLTPWRLCDSNYVKLDEEKVRVFQKGETYVVTAESKLQNYHYMNDSSNIKQRKFVKIEGAWYPMCGINTKAIFAEINDTNETYKVDEKVRVHSRLGVWMEGKYKGESELGQYRVIMYRVYVKEQGRIVLIPKDEPARIQKFSSLRSDWGSQTEK